MSVFFALRVGRKGVLDSKNGMGQEPWSVAADHVYVRCHDVLRVEETHYAGYHAAPVAALCDYPSRVRTWFSFRERLRTIFIIPKLEHELVACLSVLRETKAFLFCARGEAEVRERRSNNVESGTLLTAIGK